jgi:3-hydroxyisobutyrate dehydrogenase-like beta-hydroxyacid dehydrogenase
MSQMQETVGFIGLGNMGEPIAAILLAAGYGLLVYNRTASKAARLVERGVRAVPSPADVAERSGIVLTMLSDDCAVEETCLAEPSFVERLGPGGTHISLSTVEPATARRLAKQHENCEVQYVAVPVFERLDAAAAKRLWICVSGSGEGKKRVERILAEISQAIYDFGEDAGGANVVKLCANFMIASAIEAMGGAFALAEKNGLHQKDVAEFLDNTLFPCPVLQGYGKQIVEKRFEPAGFRLVLALKDISLALETAASGPMPMPLASLLPDRALAAVAKGRGNLDWSALSLGAAEDAGLE